MGDLIISGAGSVTGGTYNTVSVSGSGKIKGNVICKSYKTSGSSHLDGDLECESFGCSGAAKLNALKCEGTVRISGALSAGGGITAGEVGVSGSLSCGGELAGRDLVKVSGSVKCDGSITSGSEFRSSGKTLVKGGVSAETIYISGACDVGGLINGEVIEIALTHGNCCKAGAVGGAEITVKRRNESDGGNIIEALRGFVVDVRKAFFPDRDAETYFETDTIEGDTISLEYTHANVVRGKDIIIGEGCKIARVEYTGKVTYSDAAEIGEMVEI